MANILFNVLLAMTAVVLTRHCKGVVDGLISRFQTLSRRKALCIVLVAACPILIRLALLGQFPVPEPTVHDEFSYLLGADTFREGRLANPPHPMWQFFETFHVNFIPTYSSRYPPAQAAFLAVGWKLFGHPWAGSLIGVAFMAGAVCWMFQGFLPPAWALLGALLFALQTGVLTYWVNSYWGGAVAAGAGALVIGAAPRIMRRGWMRDGIPFAAGMLILANCRPFEGLVLVAAVGVPLLVSAFRQRRMHWLASVTGGAVLTLLVVGLYDYRLTGDPLLMPYKLHQQRYEVAPLFVFMEPKQIIPQYSNETFRQYWAVWDVDLFNGVRKNLWSYTAAKLFLVLKFFIRSWPLMIPLALIPFLVSSKGARLPLAVLVIFTAAVCLEKATFPHYFAPAAPILFLLLTMAIRRIGHWRPGQTLSGRALAAVLLVCFLGQFVIAAARGGISGDIYTSPQFAERRREVIDQLTRTPGKHLVLVHYGGSHDFHQEWIYNRADIDHSVIIWARDIDPLRDQPLLDYYPDRHVWKLDPDGPKYTLTSLR